MSGARARRKTGAARLTTKFLPVAYETLRIWEKGTNPLSLKPKKASSFECKKALKPPKNP
jgi:hypothetical protein